MPQINLGTVANDNTGSALRMGGQLINQYGLLGDKTVNAAFYKTASITNEAAITLAIVAAVSLGTGAAVWVPASMLPYNASLVTFNTAIRMVREGGNPSVWDVRAYGAAVDGTTDDLAALTAAIQGAGATTGGIVLLGNGNMKFSSSLLLNKDDVWLQGMGRNVSVLLCSNVAVDAVKVTGQRCRITDCGINYSATANAGTYALRLTDVGRGRFTDSVIGATNGSPSNAYHGLLIEATAGSSAENVVRNFFQRVLVGNCIGVGVTMTGASLSRRVIDQEFLEMYVSGCTDTGWIFNDFVQGIFVQNGVTDFCGRGVNVLSTNTLNTFNLFFFNIKFDAGQTNEYFKCVNTRECYLQQCWFADVVAGQYGILIGAGTSRFVIQGCWIGGREPAGAYTGCIQVLGNSTCIRGNYFKQGAIAPTTAAVVVGAGTTLNDVTLNTFEGFAVGKDISDAGTATRIGPNYDDAYGGVAQFISSIDGSRVGAAPVLITPASAIIAKGAAGGQSIRFGTGSPACMEVQTFNQSAYDSLRVGALFTVNAAPTAAAGQVAFGATTATTIGANGAASALTANPVGYLIINVAGTQMKIPYYNT